MVKFAQKQNKKICSDFTPFISKSFQIWDHLFPLLFCKDSESQNCLTSNFGKWGAKRHLNGTSKVNRQTHGRSRIGQEGRFFENIYIYTIIIIVLLLFVTVLSSCYLSWQNIFGQQMEDLPGSIQHGLGFRSYFLDTEFAANWPTQKSYKLL